MTPDPFVVRAQRALRRPPRYWAARVSDALGRRTRRRWSWLTPRLLTERGLLRATGTVSIDELWEKQKRQPFFFSSLGRESWTRAFEDAFDSGRAEVLRAADRAVGHEFDLLGSGPRVLGPRLPWHADFKSGREWPLQYASDIQYAELDRPSDVKVPWELSRCQHFTALGQAYWLTGAEQYAREFVAEVDDWIARNPWGYGVNWACAMDVALRAVSWLWGFYFLSDADACRSRKFRGRFLRSLFLHGEHIATHLERGEVNGNHYLCDGIGLVFLGLFFGATNRGRRWLGLGRSIVISEIDLQTTADGVDFEQSTAYHRLVLEGFATAYLLLQAAGETVPESAWSRLERMYEYVAAYTKPDGAAPLVGDADDGRIQKLGPQRLNDHRYLLSTGAILFKRPDFKRAAGGCWEESFWLLGPSGLETFERIASDDEPGNANAGQVRSRAFRDGGVFILRSRDTHVVIDCAEVGMRGRGGHGHNDILSFELWMNGSNWITDCGAYLYTASREWRNRFRSTAFHNTPQIDGEELNRFVGPDALWQLHYDAIPRDVVFACGTDSDRFAGAHRGYERLSNPVTVSREIVIDRKQPRVWVRDTFTGSGTHDIVSRFHLDPDVSAEIDGRAVRLVNRSSGGELGISVDEPATFSISLEPGWVSTSYGVKVPTMILVCAGTAAVPVELSYTFSASGS